MRANLTGTVMTLVAVVWGLVGCNQPASDPSSGSGSGLTLSVGKSVDLSQVAKGKALGFHRSGATARAQGYGHRLDLGQDAVVLTPVAGPRQRQRVEGKVAALLHARDRDSFRSARAALKQAVKRESPELSLRALSVARAGYECVQGNGQVNVTADDMAERHFETCSELWKNGETSAEQSFRFEQRPDGSGDLVIQIRARIGGTAPTSVTTAADGLHLEGATGERYVYGHGHWVDAAGRRIEVEAKFNGEAIELTIPATTIDSSSYPAVLDPVVGPEIGTDTPVPFPTTLGSYPAVASNGSGFLAVQSVNGNIRAVRVDNNGSVLDLPSLDFGEATGSQYYPNVTWGNGHYLVSWAQFGETDADPDTVHARFVKSDGTLEGTANFQLAGENALYPKLVWDGAHYIGAWLGLSGAGVNNIQSALFNPDGSVVVGTTHSVATSGSTTDPCIALGTNQALIAWEDYSATPTYVVNGARIDFTGAIKDTTPLVLSPTTSSSVGVALGSNGTNFLVTWNTAGGNYAVRGAVVNDAGSVIAGDFAISHSTGTAALPTVDFDGTNYLVAWADSRDSNSVYGVNVSPTGVVASTTDTRLATGAPRYVSSGGMDRVNLAYNGARHLVTFLGDGIEGSLLEKTLGIVNGKIALSAVPNLQGYPRMVYDGKNYVVVWTDERNGNSSSTMIVRGVRISGTGEVLDPNGLSISPAGTAAWGVALASVGNQTSQLFYVSSGAPPNQRTLATDGTLGTPRAFGATVLNSTPNVVSNGTTYLATTATSSSSSAGVYGRILDASGNLGTEFTIDASTASSAVATVPTKGGYLVFYSNSGTRVVTVSDTGQVGTSSLLASGSQDVGGGSSSTETLVAWSNMTDYNIHGRFFKDGAFSGNEFTIAQGTRGYAPAVTWDGTSYLVVWEIENHNLLGRSVSGSGALGTTYTLVSDDCAGPVLASNGQGQILLSYAKYGELSQSRRVYSRLITQGGATNVPESTAGAAGVGNGQGGSTGVTAQGGTSTAAGGSMATTAGGSGGTGTGVSAGGSTATGTATAGGTTATTAVGSGGSSGAGTTTSTGSTASTGTTGNGGSTGTGTSSGGTTAVGTTTTTATGSTAATTTAPSAVNKPPADDGGCRMSHRGNPSKPWFALVASALAATALRGRRRRA